MLFVFLGFSVFYYFTLVLLFFVTYLLLVLAAYLYVYQWITTSSQTQKQGMAIKLRNKPLASGKLSL